MKMPLNFAILQYFTTVERASADEVIAALAPEYGNYRGLRRSAVEEARRRRRSTVCLKWQALSWMQKIICWCITPQMTKVDRRSINIWTDRERQGRHAGTCTCTRVF